MKPRRLSLLITLSIMVVLLAGPAFADSGGGEIYYSKPLKSVLFSHRLHVDEKGLSCDMCHTKLFEMQALAAQGRSDFNMNSLYKGKYCGACHNGRVAFASNTQCARCHGGVKEYEAAKKAGKINASGRGSGGPKNLVYKPKGIGAVTFSHEFHTNAFGCKDCHTKVFRMKKGGNRMTMDAMNDGKFCGKCHNGKEATAVSECAKCHAQ
ncbi:MAG TPA: cytochrome c3 family protein [Nitrospirota bacterium]|nr:cytochrome c3 family protein [Nitrospirota bacterium]